MIFLHEFIGECQEEFPDELLKESLDASYLRPSTNISRNPRGIPVGLSGEILGVNHAVIFLVVPLVEFLNEILEECIEEFVS